MDKDNKPKSYDLDRFKNALKRFDMKATPQRIAVHEAMMQLGHASADMVAEIIQKSSQTRITVASVYNILSQLAILGIYRHRLSANNKMYFDVTTHRHIHVYDRENHTYRDLIDEELMEMIHSHIGRKKFKGFSVEDIDIQIICRPTKRKLPLKKSTVK